MAFGLYNAPVRFTPKSAPCNFVLLINSCTCKTQQVSGWAKGDALWTVRHSVTVYENQNHLYNILIGNPVVTI
jgi:hypothetical protein